MYFITLKGNCKNINLSEDVYKFWRDIAAKPIRQAPVTKELAFARNHDRLPSEKCEATLAPATNYTVFERHVTKI